MFEYLGEPRKAGRVELETGRRYPITYVHGTQDGGFVVMATDTETGRSGMVQYEGIKAFAREWAYVRGCRG